MKLEAKEAFAMICGEKVRVELNQISKSKWHAYGTYNGRGIEAEGSSAGSALSFWESRANAKEFD